jgi:hypothetical protein
MQPGFRFAETSGVTGLQAEIHPRQEDKRRSAPRFEMKDASAFNSVHILFVEDDARVERSVIEAFSACRIANRVRSVPSIEEALEVLRQSFSTEPWVILLDWERFAPEREVLITDLESDPYLAEIPLVLLTGPEGCATDPSNLPGSVVGRIRKERAGEDFVNLLSSWEKFWKIVEAPVGD